MSVMINDFMRKVVTATSSAKKLNR